MVPCHRISTSSVALQRRTIRFLSAKMIEFRNVRKRLVSQRNSLALIVEDFSIKDGSCISVVGENGTGKTTLLRMISGSLKPDFGEIIVSSPTIAFTNIERQLHYRLTVAENIVYLAALFGSSPAQSLLSKMSSDVGLSDHLYTKVAKLSKGQKTRLVLILLKMYQWKTVILDEPTLGLDQNGLELFGQIVHGLRERGAVILISSHDISTIRKISDGIISITHGGKVQLGKTDSFEAISLFEVNYTDGAHETLNIDQIRQILETKADCILNISRKGLSVSDVSAYGTK